MIYDVTVYIVRPQWLTFSEREKNQRQMTSIDGKLQDKSFLSHFGHLYFIVIRINCDLSVM